MAKHYVEHVGHDIREDASNFCEHSIVKVHPPFGLILFILNCFLPGVGSIISSFMDSKFNALACLFGVMQLLLCLTIVVWIWSIWHGYMIWHKSR